MKKPATSVLFLVALSIPGRADAHIRWFMENGAVFPEQQLTMDTTNWLLIAGAILFAVVALLVHRYCKSMAIARRLDAAAPSLEPKLWRAVAALSGLMLVINTIMKIYLAPNLSLTGEGVTWFGLIAQLLVGILLLGQISFSISGFLIYVAAALAIFFNPIALIVDYLFEFAALGLSLILIGPSLSKLDKTFMNAIKFDVVPLRHLALPIIRIGVGLSLVTLAIHNKFLSPGMSVAFLQEYPLNFMPHIGFAEFSDLHYTFAAGVAELTIGLLILFNIATRFVVGVLTVFFLSTLLTLPVLELVGHLPLFGIAVLLILCGGGSARAANAATETVPSGEEGLAAKS